MSYERARAWFLALTGLGIIAYDLIAIRPVDVSVLIIGGGFMGSPAFLPPRK